MLSFGKNATKDGKIKTVQEIMGLSTDEKPTNVGNGSVFIEMDTGNIYMFDGENEQWLRL